MIICGIATSLNILSIVIKFRKRRILNGLLDLILFLVVVFICSGSLGALQIGMIASAIISAYLLLCPINIKAGGRLIR